MMDARRYFDAQARIGRAWLHPGGAAATQLLLDRARPPASAPRLLELGCGPGRTGRACLERWGGHYTQ